MVSWGTGTCILVDAIHTGATMLAWTAGALVYITLAVPSLVSWGTNTRVPLHCAGAASTILADGSVAVGVIYNNVTTHMRLHCLVCSD